MTSSTDETTKRPVDWLLFLFAPVFFSSNLVFGRGLIGDVAPFTSAFIRWGGSTLIVLPFIWSDRGACIAFIRHNTRTWLLLGFLGMGVCGGFVYWSLTYTTASNATLIYTTSSLFIILFQWAFSGRALRPQELIGMAIAFAGVAVIVLKGNIEALADMRFNIGDFGILAAAIAFAIYSLMLRNSAVKAMKPMSLFALVALAGAVVLLPAAAFEFFTGGAVPDDARDWMKMAGIILFASLAAFYCFQHSVRVFGPALAGTTLYLMPPASILMAILFLGERFETYHAVGIVLVTGGVVAATLNSGLPKKRDKSVTVKSSTIDMR